MRTPLSHILGFSELIGNESVGPLNERQREYLDDVRNSGNHLLALINDLLDLSQIESGQIELNIERVDPRTLLEESIKVVSNRAIESGIDIETKIDNLPDEIVVDARMIRQVLFNLLQNALKFTEPGGNVNLFGASSGGEILEIRVVDTGVGLSADDTDRIFGEFVQIEQKGKRFSGAGLGLAICRRLVELHGGTITAECAGPGKGSTFTVRIPIEPIG